MIKRLIWLFAGALVLFVSPFVFAQEMAVNPNVDTGGVLDMPEAGNGDGGAIVSGVAQSQDEAVDASLDPNLYIGLQEGFQNHMKLGTPEVRPEQLKTIFFTLWQHQLLLEAKRQFTTRPPSESELSADSGEMAGERARGIREIRVGGILYGASENWVVWLNGQRVTPQAIPKEVMDIRVRKDYVELKWYDSFSNLVYPVRLQPHQRFNLDSRIFLPGTSL